VGVALLVGLIGNASVVRGPLSAAVLREVAKGCMVPPYEDDGQECPSHREKKIAGGLIGVGWQMEMGVEVVDEVGRELCGKVSPLRVRCGWFLVPKVSCPLSVVRCRRGAVLRGVAKCCILGVRG